MIGIAGAGAFGTALAIALAREGRDVTLWARDTRHLRDRRESPHLPGVTLPDSVSITAEVATLSDLGTILLALPTQALHGFLAGPGQSLRTVPLVACCKGVDLATLTGPTSVITTLFPGTTPALLTGPSFAADIARGLPTALTLACSDDNLGEGLQSLLSTATLRLYRTDDVTGAELGGALKNVIAIAAGITIGAGLGDSARAALMTRGYAEMVRLATALGARAETLAGLSGFGDLVLTCTSDQSRNFRYGRALGAGQPFDTAITVEGAATARAVTRLAALRGIDIPLTAMVAALIDGQIDLPTAIQTLLTRPLRKE